MSKWKDILKTVAPTVAGALGGPWAGMGIKAVADVLFADGERPDTPKQLMKAVAKALPSATPEQLQAITVADTQLKMRLAELQVDLERIHQRDRQSARNREAKVGGVTTPVLGFFVVFGFLGSVGVVLWRGLPDDMNQETILLVGTLIGHLSSKADRVMGYFFGSSSETANGNSVINRMLKAGRKE